MKPLVLIVDDDASAREIARRVVVSVVPSAMDIELAIDGRSAIEVIERRTPSLILLDLMMPGMTGFDVLKRLYGDPVTRRIRVIVVSAITYSEMIGLQGTYGVSAVVSKAQGIGPLISALREALPCDIQGEDK